MDNYKKKLDEYQNDPNYIEIIDLGPHLTYEQVILRLVEVPILEKEKNKEKNKAVSEYPFIHTRGFSTRQNLEINGLPNTIKILNHDFHNFVEVNLLNLKQDANFDCMTNIRIRLETTNLDLTQNRIECVLKFRNNVACSKLIEQDEPIELIKFPNIIINCSRYFHDNAIWLALRMKKDLLIHRNKLKFYVEYDAIFLDVESLQKVSKINSYFFETTTGVLIYNLEDKFAPRYVTQLWDSVDPAFRFLYNFESKKEDLTDEITNVTI